MWVWLFLINRKKRPSAEQDASCVPSWKKWINQQIWAMSLSSESKVLVWRINVWNASNGFGKSQQCVPALGQLLRHSVEPLTHANTYTFFFIEIHTHIYKYILHMVFWNLLDLKSGTRDGMLIASDIPPPASSQRKKATSWTRLAGAFAY